MSSEDVYLGDELYEYPSQYLGELEDHTELYRKRQFDELRREIQAKGYLLIRQFHKKDEVINARKAILEYINISGEGKFQEGSELESGVLDSRCGRGCIPFIEGRNEITHHPAVAGVLEGPIPKQFFRELLGEEPLTFDFKWLRGIHRQAFTGVHVDNVYMGRGTGDLYTIWTPFGDIEPKLGTVAIVEGSNWNPDFKSLQDTYGSCDLEKEAVEGSGWFTESPSEITSRFGGSWKTTRFEAGDVLIFPSRTLHMSTKNMTDRIRISCDTRWQRKSNPVDPRFVGESFEIKTKHGLWADDEENPEQENIKEEKKIPRTMEEMKEIWGFV